MCRQLICLVLAVFCLSLIPMSTGKAELIAWWRFEEGSGDTAEDSSGNNHHGTLLGTPEWGGGAKGGAIVFDPDGCVGMDCGVFDPTDGTGHFSLALWAFWDGTGEIQHFLTKSNGWGADTMMIQVELWAANDSAAHADRIGASYQPIGSIPFSLMPVNEWVHLTWTFDGSNMRVYLNGVDEEGPKTFSIGPNVNAQVEIGYNSNRPTPGERTFHGTLDEIRLYSHALSDVEVLAAMKGEPWPYAFGPDPEDGALHADTWVTLSWSPGDSAVSHDVYLGDDFDVVTDATRDSDEFRGNQTLTYYVAGFPGFAYPEGLVPGTTYYWRIDEVNDADPDSPWKGLIWSFSIPPKTSYNPDPPDGAGLADTAVTLSWTPGFGSKLHTVYFGEDYDEVNNATVGVPRGTASYDPGSLEREKVYYWRVDEFDGLGTYKGDVWTFTTPGAVGSPQPANGAADVTMATVLSWTPADNAASHEVYLGVDKDTVRSADSASPEYKGSKALGAESYDAGLLEPDTTYYWRVDEVYNGNPVKGPVWSFTVGAYLLVEDFESYTDNDADGEAIWQTWIDGFGIADNGAQVGYLMPPYAEQTIVHGGLQSMPLLYTNEAGVTNSEASLTLTARRDWTMAGVGELSLWFQGDSANAADPLYVAISNSAGIPGIVVNDDSEAALARGWTQMVIPLQAFADQGINLTNVDKLAIGLGSKAGAAAGGSGTMFIDDIRLYRP